MLMVLGWKAKVWVVAMVALLRRVEVWNSSVKISSRTLFAFFRGGCDGSS